MKRYLNIIAMLLALILTFSVFALAEEAGPTDPETPPTTTDAPATDTPTEKPTEKPTETPTEKPTDEPTDEPTVEPHVHDYSVLLRQQAASCSNEGFKEWKCSKCESRYVETTPQEAHDYSALIRTLQPATCEEAGLGEFKCSKCGQGHEVLEIPAKGHTPSDWQVVTPATPGKAGEQQKVCTVCGTVLDTEEIPALPTKKPSKPSKTPVPEQPVVEDEPAMPYGSIVSDIARAEQTYTAKKTVEGGNDVLVITADPDATGAYVLRNLHLTNEVLAQFGADGIDVVRFVVGGASVEIPMVSFDSATIASVKNSIEGDETGYIVTVDPQAIAETGETGCKVSVSMVAADASEVDITSLVENVTLTLGGQEIPVTESKVYTAAVAA